MDMRYTLKAKQYELYLPNFGNTGKWAITRQRAYFTSLSQIRKILILFKVKRKYNIDYLKIMSINDEISR